MRGSNLPTFYQKIRECAAERTREPSIGEASSWQLEWYTIPGRHTPDVRSVNGVQTDNPGVDIPRLLEEVVYRFCAQSFPKFSKIDITKP